MSSDPRESSLERFLRSRGLVMLGNTHTKQSTALQIGIGWVVLVFGFGFLAAPLVGAPQEFMFGSIGPFAAGLINLGMGYGFRKRLQNEPREVVNLTPEAKALLNSLVRQFNSTRYARITDPVWQTQSYVNTQQIKLRFEVNQRSLPPVSASQAVVDALDLAASQYNRIAAVLTSTSSGSTLGKMAPRIALASDEAMAEALHQAAIWSAYPEGSTATAGRLMATTEALRELAERTETLASQEPSLSEKLGYRSGIDDVLEELRLDQLARSELHSRPDAPQDHRA